MAFGKRLMVLLAGLLLTGGMAEAADLSGQLKALDKQIAHDKANGNLTAEQTEKLRSSLKGIKDEESRLKASGALSKPDLSRLQSRLHALQEDLARVRRRSTTVHDPFRDKAAKLEAEIGSARATSQISAVEATALKRDLEHLRDKHSEIVTSGQLTQEKSDQLTREVASLRSRLAAHQFKN